MIQVTTDQARHMPPPHPSGPFGPDTDLIEGVRAGDPEAMAVLYDRHRERGLVFAKSLASDIHEAEDILHQAFTKVVSAIRNGAGPTDKFGPYLSTAIRSSAKNLWNHQMRERPTELEDLDREPAEDPGLEAVLSVFEHEKITAAMRSLPERWRTVLWHAEILGQKPRDIAPVLGIEPNAVSALLIRARAGLRAAYDQQPGHRTPTADSVLAWRPRHCPSPGN